MTLVQMNDGNAVVIKLNTEDILSIRFPIRHDAYKGFPNHALLTCFRVACVNDTENIRMVILNRPDCGP